MKVKVFIEDHEKLVELRNQRLQALNAGCMALVQELQEQMYEVKEMTLAEVLTHPEEYVRKQATKLLT